MIIFIVLNFIFSQNNLKSNIDKYFKKYKDSSYSYYFYDFTNKKELISYNKEKKLAIASVSKLFTTGASIDFLGLDFRFKTNIFSDENNNIYIKGGGDPVFVSETMWFLVNELVNFNFTSINNIILDTSLFENINYKYSENDRAYSAIISPLLVNFNSIAVNIVSGERPLVILDPQLHDYLIIDKTTKTSKPNSFSLNRNKNKIVISGNINNQNLASKKIYRNIEDPTENFLKTLELHLLSRGIKLKGKILNSKVTSNAKSLFTIESKRLVDLLIDMNKFSSNLIAEQLLLALAAKQNTNLINKEEGVKIIYNHFEKLGLNKSYVFLENASGLSLKNVASSEFIVSYLNKILSDINLSPEFISSLSISGTDGTIKNTMTNRGIKTIVRAKTGSLNNVRSIAGLINLNEKIVLFAIIVNDAKAHELMFNEEKILLELKK